MVPVAANGTDGKITIGTIFKTPNVPKYLEKWPITCQIRKPGEMWQNSILIFFINAFQRNYLAQISSQFAFSLPFCLLFSKTGNFTHGFSVSIVFFLCVSVIGRCPNTRVFSSNLKLIPQWMRLVHVDVINFCMWKQNHWIDYFSNPYIRCQETNPAKNNNVTYKHIKLD